MKIGKFAKENGISIDTVRYYIDEGLLIVEKVGSQYEFDNRCREDIIRIKKLKDMGYKINEIAVFLTFFRLGKESINMEDDFYMQFYESKLESNIKKIEEIEMQNIELKKNIEDSLNLRRKEERVVGINVNSLRLLACHSCGGDLVISDAVIEDNHIISGNLLCACGTKYSIVNGIVVSENIRSNPTKIVSIVDYIEDVNNDYLKNISKSLEWLYKKIQPIELESEVLLELGSGTGFLLRYIYDDLPRTTTYIAVDYDINRHIFLSNLIRRSNKDVNILFICSDFNEMPLKENVADIVIDYAGTTNYAFENEDFLLKSIDRYFKRDVLLLFVSIMFEKYGIESMIDEKYRHNFNEAFARSEIIDLGYGILSEKSSDSTNEASEKYENFFKRDEKVYVYRAHAKRK